MGISWMKCRRASTRRKQQVNVSISACVEQHQASEDSEGVTVTMPVLTALPLNHDGVLSPARGQCVELTIVAVQDGANRVATQISYPLMFYCALNGAT
jgi:hypothetical protein